MYACGTVKGGGHYTSTGTLELLTVRIGQARGRRKTKNLKTWLCWFARYFT